MAAMSQLVAGPLENNVYLVNCPESGRLYIIDPAYDARRICDAAGRYSFAEAVVLLTHAHADHIGALKEVVEKLRVKQILLDPADVPMYRSPHNALIPFLPAQTDLPETVPAVGGADFQVLRTPGHTPGGVCYYFPALPALFSGDTLFCESVGRTDLPGGSGRELINSIKHAILSNLQDDLAVYPGHGPATTVGHERHCNPYIA